MTGTGDQVDAAWLAHNLRAAEAAASTSSDWVARLKQLLQEWAAGFAARRPDVVSPSLTWPRRGLMPDEASSFLRAIDSGFAAVDEAGYVGLPRVREKSPVGRYALFSRSGSGVSLNLEYLIQIGATAELVLDHSWPAGSIEFERGEFDALVVDDDDQILVAMEAKARTSGPDSLQTLVTTWLQQSQLAEPDQLHTNAGRKLSELRRLTVDRPVLVWLVASGARWSIWAESDGACMRLTAATSPDPAVVVSQLKGKRPMYDAHPYDSSLHRPGTAAHAGHCSWHGPVSCPNPPVVSFQDAQRKWQSGCQRAVNELVARGEIRPPVS